MDRSFSRAVEFAGDLIRIPSVSGSEEEVAHRVLRELRELGFDDAWIDEVGNVIGRVAGTGGGPTVMLSSHLDIVDAGDAAGWEYDPFGGVVADGFLHGRGAMDIKGPLAIQTYAAAAFLDQRPVGDVIVAHTVYEERGGWGMQHLLEKGDVRPDAVIIGESTGGDICTGHRGRAELMVEISGVAGHASAPDRARNPLYCMGSVLEAIRRFGELLGNDRDPELGVATAAPTEVRTLPASRNVIPDQAIITIDWRVLPGWTADRTISALESFLRDHARLDEGCTLSVRMSTENQRSYTGLERESEMFSPGFLLPQDHPVPQAAAAAAEPFLGRRPHIRPWAFATDGGHTCGIHGIPTIGFAPGEERHAHTNRERLDLADASRVFAAYPSVIASVQESLAA
ncbi:MAG TPA: M20/M25/M40 family metallo-hydrolase [Longimicrobiales bacterium]|nr:M20/M25/M40 family metallo-hydrolase [Longimicrobiales bacterium]